MQQEGSWENTTEKYINETYSQEKASGQVWHSYWILEVINLKITDNELLFNDLLFTGGFSDNNEFTSDYRHAAATKCINDTNNDLSQITEKYTTNFA